MRVTTSELLQLVTVRGPNEVDRLVDEGVVAPRAPDRPHPRVVGNRGGVVSHRTLSADLGCHQDNRVMIQGWIHRRRRLSSVSFLILRDRSGLAQVVVTDKRSR